MIEARCHDSPALAQLEYVESVLPSVQLSTQQLEAWVEFLDRGRRHDA
jgi:hypothetical protein